MLKDLLNEKLIKTDVDCKNWQEVIDVTGNMLLENGFIKENFIEKMKDVVRQYGPYMIIVPEVCFFHGPASSDVNKTGISLITLKKPVIFDDFDNEEIKCAFAFAATDTNSHIELLQNLTALLDDEEFVSLLTNNGNKKDILEKIKKLGGN